MKALLRMMRRSIKQDFNRVTSYKTQKRYKTNSFFLTKLSEYADYLLLTYSNIIPQSAKKHDLILCMGSLINGKKIRVLKEMKVHTDYFNLVHKTLYNYSN